MAGALHVSPEAGAPVRVVSQGPFSVGSRLWRDARGRLTCTIVAKATYELTPGESAPLDEPHPIQEEDAHWDGDPSRSVHVPSDLAPFKRAAEVVVAGSAFASQSAASILTRVVVGGVDKSLEVFPPRFFTAAGGLEAGASLARYPLRYERAAGGPETDNPVGIDVSRVDGRGRFPVPELLPPFHALGPPASYVPTCGFGALASTWPSRAGLLGSHDRAWLRHPSAAPMPAAFPPNFFQTAPPDQWLDRPLAANERIVLEGLCPEVRRLVMTLSGPEPRAVVAGPRPEVVRLTGDLLFVDTERGICTITFRGQIPFEGRGARVIVVGVPVAAELSPEDVRSLAQLDEEDIETTHVEGHLEGHFEGHLEGLSLDPPMAGSTNLEIARSSRPVLPFGFGPPPRPPQPSNPDGVLPFGNPGAGTSEFAPAPVPAVVPTSPPPVRVPLPAPVPVPVSPPFSVAAPPPLSAPAPVFVPSLASVPVPASTPAIVPVPAPAIVPSPMAALAPAPAPVPAPAPGSGAGTGPRLLSEKFKAAFAGVKAASDAAALSAAGAAPQEAPVRAAAGAVSQASGQRQAVVSLLCFDAAVAPRLRRAKRFAAAFEPKTSAKRAQDVHTPHQEPPRDERSDVLRVLSFGQPADAAEIHRALADSLDDPHELDLPLVLVAGELRPTFDEVEVLRATVAVVKQVAGDNKKVLGSLAVGQEALAAPIAPRSETALGLARQIEQAASSLSLPPRYVPAEVERVLGEGRKYKVLTVLGAPRVRADLTPAGGGDAMPLYLPETAATSLPRILAFPVVALCEIVPREDLTEAPDEALLAVALGRVMRSR